MAQCHYARHGKALPVYQQPARCGLGQDSINPSTMRTVTSPRCHVMTDVADHPQCRRYSSLTTLTCRNENGLTNCLCGRWFVCNFADIPRPLPLVLFSEWIWSVTGANIALWIGGYSPTGSRGRPTTGVGSQTVTIFVVSCVPSTSEPDSCVSLISVQAQHHTTSVAVKCAGPEITRQWYVCYLHHGSNWALVQGTNGHIMRYSNSATSETVKRCWSRVWLM